MEDVIITINKRQETIQLAGWDLCELGLCNKDCENCTTIPCG